MSKLTRAVTPSPITGDVFEYTATAQEGVTLHNMPTILESQLLKAGANINQYQDSGKKLGAAIVGVTVDGNGVVTKATLFIASGSAPTSIWKVAAQLVGSGTDLTPVAA